MESGKEKESATMESGKEEEAMVGRKEGGQSDRGKWEGGGSDGWKEGGRKTRTDSGNTGRGKK